MKINLKGMTRKELQKLKADIDKALVRVEETEKRKALQAAEKAAKAMGYSLSELEGLKSATKAKTARPKKASDGRAKVAPKYRNPNDPDETWTGRGRKPKWVVAYQSGGGSLDDILI